MSYRERGRNTWHIPDGVVRDPKVPADGPTRHIAIEIELTHKSRRQLSEDVFTKFRAGVESVLYFAPDEAFAERLRTDIAAVCEQLGSNKRWHVQLLPDVSGVDYMTGAR